MDSEQDVSYRLRLAEGFFQEAMQDLDLSRWRSCVDNAQLSVFAKGGLSWLRRIPLNR